MTTKQPQPTIAQATPEDMPELLAIQKEAYQAEAQIYDDSSLPPLTETLEDMKNSAANGVLLKAEIDGVPVGSIRATLQGKTCAIGRLSVKPKHQRRGIGRALLHACETIFPAANTCELFTGAQSAANIKLYETLGYQRRQKCAANHCGPNIALIYLQKKLPPRNPAQ